MSKPTSPPRRGPGTRVIEIDWQHPPPDVPKYVVPFMGVLEELRAKPEHWARIATFSSLSGGTTAEKKLAEAMSALELGTFEFASRRIDEGSALWGRCTAPE